MRLPARLHLSRHGIYYYRLVVPRHLRVSFGRCEYRCSLNTRDPHAAQQAAYAINAYVGRLFSNGGAMAQKNLMLKLCSATSA